MTVKADTYDAALGVAGHMTYMAAKSLPEPLMQWTWHGVILLFLSWKRYCNFYYLVELQWVMIMVLPWSQSTRPNWCVNNLATTGWGWKHSQVHMCSGDTHQGLINALPIWKQQLPTTSTAWEGKAARWHGLAAENAHWQHTHGGRWYRWPLGPGRVICSSNWPLLPLSTHE